MNSSTPTGLDRYVNALATVNTIVAVVLFAGLVVVVALQVLTRFVLHLPMIWSEEAARFLFFWVVMLGAALSVKARRHFVIDVTMGHADKLGRTGRFLFDILPDVCIVAMSLFLLWQGLGYTRAGFLRTAPNSSVNMGLVYAAIPTFAALSSIYSIASLLKDVSAFMKGGSAERRPAPAAE